MHRSLIPAIIVLTFSAAANAAPEEFVLDSDHTFPTFEVRHLGIATQRGRFNRTAGKIFLDLDAAFRIRDDHDAELCQR
jgi:polyisoprenoid-binding protein YceI